MNHSGLLAGLLLLPWLLSLGSGPRAGRERTLQPGRVPPFLLPGTEDGLELQPGEFQQPGPRLVAPPGILEAGEAVLRAGREAVLRAGREAGRALIADLGHRWPGATVPYTLDASFSSTQRTVVAGALLEIMDHTCIRLS